MTTHPASRFLYAVRHALPYTEEGAREYWNFLLKMATSALRNKNVVYRRVILDSDIQEAAAEYMSIMLDPTTHPAWRTDDEATLWRKAANDYIYKFLRCSGNEILHEGQQPECSSAQKAECITDESHRETSTGDLAEAGKYFLPAAADTQKAREIFFRCLDCYRRSEWPTTDENSLAKHVLLYYARYDWLSLKSPDSVAQSTEARQALKRRYGLKQNELVKILGLKSDTQASNLKHEAEQQCHADPEAAVTPIEEQQLLTMVSRLDSILSDPDRY